MDRKTTYDLVRQRARQRGLDIDRRDVERIAGTLRIAGVGPLDDYKNAKTAAAIVDRELANHAVRRVRNSSQRTASTKGNLREARGQCPNCQAAMSTVKLADYEEAMYCNSCRATLWPN